MKLSKLDEPLRKYNSDAIFNVALDVPAMECLTYAMTAKLNHIAYSTSINFSKDEVRFYFETEEDATFIALMKR